MTGRIAGATDRSRFAGQASDAQRTLGQTGELYLNALPLTFAGAAEQAVARILPRANERDNDLSRDDDRGAKWEHYAYAKHSYAWSLVGDELPEAFRSTAETVKFDEVPAAVVAFAAREAAARKLISDGFDRRRGGIGMPARLSRHRVNLALQVMKELPDGVGAFAAIALQGLTMTGDASRPGRVALVVDQWVEHRLPVPLDKLVDCGIEPLGLRVRWRHEGCGCRARRAGDAGRVVGGNRGCPVLRGTW